MHSRALILVVVFTLSGLGLRAADSFAINFQATAENTMAKDATAGDQTVSRDHWNNILITNTDPNGKNNNGLLEEVKGDDGEVLDGVEVSVIANGSGQVFPQNGETWGFKDGNGVMHKGLITPDPRVEISGIPFSTYDVYVYLGAGNNGGKGVGAIAAAGSGDVDSNEYGYNFQWLNGDFIAATSDNTVAEPEKANMLVFRGNTAGGCIITLDGRKGGGWIGIAGIQVVKAD